MSARYPFHVSIVWLYLYTYRIKAKVCTHLFYVSMIWLYPKPLVVSCWKDTLWWKIFKDIHCVKQKCTHTFHVSMVWLYLESLAVGINSSGIALQCKQRCSFSAVAYIHFSISNSHTAQLNHITWGVTVQWRGAPFLFLAVSISVYQPVIHTVKHMPGCLWRRKKQRRRRNSLFFDCVAVSATVRRLVITFTMKHAERQSHNQSDKSHARACYRNNRYYTCYQQLNLRLRKALSTLTYDRPCHYSRYSDLIYDRRA